MTRTWTMKFISAAVGIQAALALAPLVAHAGDGKPETTAVTGDNTYDVRGFRSAEFGMTEDQLRGAIIKDFGVEANKIARIENPKDGTLALAVQVPSLDPGPGPATLTYLLGKTSRTLMHVNVVWLANGVDAARRRNDMIGAAERLKAYFVKKNWRGNVVMADIPIGPNNIVMFLGKDHDGSSVEVRLDGVAFEKQQSGQPNFKSPPPPDAVRLKVSYALDPDKPDVAKIAPGRY